MFLIAGLGNPGKKYSKNRHNVGFMAVDHLASGLGISINTKKFSADTAFQKTDSADILILKPLTFINRSGVSISAALDFYKIEPASLIVLHDEIELPFGKILLKHGGGHKGHNGLRSIIQQTGSADFHRIRIGVGRPENEIVPVADHVLSNFTPEESEQLPEILSTAADMLNELINKLTNEENANNQ